MKEGQDQWLEIGKIAMKLMRQAKKERKSFLMPSDIKLRARQNYTD